MVIYLIREDPAFQQHLCWMHPPPRGASPGARCPAQLIPFWRQPGSPTWEFVLFCKNYSASPCFFTISSPLRLPSRLIDYFLISALLNSHIRLTVTYVASFTLQPCPISSYYEEHNRGCVVTASLTAGCTWSTAHHAGPCPGSRFTTKSERWLFAWHPVLGSRFSNVLFVSNT